MLKNASSVSGTDRFLAPLRAARDDFLDPGVVGMMAAVLAGTYTKVCIPLYATASGIASLTGKFLPCSRRERGGCRESFRAAEKSGSSRRPGPQRGEAIETRQTRPGREARYRPG